MRAVAAWTTGLTAAVLALAPAADAAEVIREVPGSMHVVHELTSAADVNARGYYSCRATVYARWEAVPGETGRAQIVFTAGGAVHTRDVSAPFSDAATHPDVPGSELPPGMHQQYLTHVGEYARVSTFCSGPIQGWSVIAVRVRVDTTCVDPAATLARLRAGLVEERQRLTVTRGRHAAAVGAATRATETVRAIRSTTTGGSARLRAAVARRERALLERHRVALRLTRDTAAVRAAAARLRDAARASASCPAAG